MSWFYILGWLPSTVAVFGNALVVFIIASRRRLHNPPNWFVMSLALADFAVGLIFFPSDYICGELALCDINIAHDIAVLAIYSSVANLCVMTTDRYLAIIKPLRYVSWMSYRRAILLVAIAWCMPLTIDFIPALCTRLGKCNLENKALVFSKMILFEILPCLFLLITTTKIITTAKGHRRQNARRNAQLRYNQPNYRRSRNVSTARVIVIVVVLFLACFSVELYSVFRFLIYSSIPTAEVVNVINFLMVVNSAVNPIAYAFFERDIRQELQKTCRKPVVLRHRSCASTAV